MAKRRKFGSFIAIQLLGSASILAVGAIATPAYAQQSSLNIPSQSAPVAITKLAKQTGTQILFDHAKLKKVKTKTVKGARNAREALEMMLAGTGYEIGDTASGALTVKPTANTSTSSGEVIAERTGRNSASSSGNDADQKGLAEILVVGSRSQNVDIRRTEDDPQPYVVFGTEEIEQSGATNLEDFFRKRLPMNAQAASDSQTASSAASNASQINLRGLGITQTLILIDGRPAPRLLRSDDVNVTRSAGGTFGQADINGIPLSAIARIEILPSTAGGIYGGGAVGGVINIIRKRDYSGLDARIGYDGTFRGGGETFRVQLNGGFALEGGRTQISFSGSHEKSEPLYAKDNSLAQRGRELFAQNEPTAFLVSGSTANIQTPSAYTPSAPGCLNFNSACFVRANLVLDDGTSLNSPRAFVPLGYAGYNSSDPSTLRTAEWLATAGRFNWDMPNDINGNYASLRNNPTVSSLNLNIRREFMPWLDIFGDMTWSVNEGHSAILALSSVVGGSPFALLPANASNNPFQQAVLVRAPFAEVRTGATGRSTNFNVTGGLIARLGRGWTANIDYQWAQAVSKNTSRLVPFSAAGATALSNGTLNVLRDMTRFPIDFEPYLNKTNPSENKNKSIQDNISARLAGSLLRLPAGQMALTLQVGRRTERVPEYTSRVENSSAPGSYYFFVTAERSQSVDNAYIELRAPIVSKMNSIPFIHELEIQASARRDQYTTRTATPVDYFISSGTGAVPAFTFSNQRVKSNNFTLAARWAPIRDFNFRGSYGTGFLPPAINQMVGYRSQLFPVVSGPGATLDPRRNNEPIGQQGVVETQAGGNANLKPENSKSLSLGVVVTPQFLTGFRFSADYTKIRKSSEIFALDITTLLPNESLFPERVVRADPSPADIAAGISVGPITFLDVSLANATRTELHAWDFQADYQVDTHRFGQFHFYAAATRQNRLARQFDPSADPFNLVGFSGGPLKWRGNIGLDWSLNNLTIGWNTQYFSDYSLLSNDPAAVAENDNIIARVAGNTRIPSEIYSDLFIRYKIPRSLNNSLQGLEVSVGVQNVFDKQPEAIAYQGATGSYSPYGDPRLRRFTLQLSKPF